MASAFALLVLVLATAQGAGAQTAPGCDVIGESELELTGTTSAPIEPIEGEEVLTIDYEYRASETAWTQEPVQIGFNVADVPTWANAVLSDKTHFIELDTPGPTSVTGYIDITVQVSADAPAYERTPFTVTAEAEEGTCVAPSEASEDLGISPGFLERWSARAEHSVIQVSLGETVSVEISVHNDGNGAIELQFEAAEPNGELGLPPGIQTVGSEKQGADNQGTFTVEYEPAETGKKNVVVLINGRSADDNSIDLESKTAKIEVRTQYSLGELSPMPVFLVIIPLLAVAHRLRKNGG